MMSRKDFKDLAQAISTVSNGEERISLAQLIGEVCDRSNDRFDWSRWNVGCGLTVDGDDLAPESD